MCGENFTHMVSPFLRTRLELPLAHANKLLLIVSPLSLRMPSLEQKLENCQESLLSILDVLIGNID